ncbi:MAG TPA: glycosyltransferase family 2 protein, partial [Allocoleopsis sp.]
MGALRQINQKLELSVVSLRMMVQLGVRVMREYPDAAVIIATAGLSSVLDQTINSVLAALPCESEIQIIVAFNGPEDRSTGNKVNVCDPRVRLSAIYVPEPGKSRAINRAALESRAEYLLFLDDDVIVNSNWYTSMLEEFERGADLVLGGVRIAPQLLRPWFTRTHRSFFADTDACQDWDLIGANYGIRREKFMALGMLNEELGPGA